MWVDFGMLSDRTRRDSQLTSRISCSLQDFSRGSAYSCLRKGTRESMTRCPQSEWHPKVATCKRDTMSRAGLTAGDRGLAATEQ